MPLQPVTRRSVPDEVFDQVLGEVVDGGIGAGESLPSERRLAEVLGVSRPAVREALQRMAATRLVEVRHGGATTVRDFRRYAGMDLLPRLLVRRGKLDASVARSVLEARLAIGPAVAALAAARGGPALAAALTETLDRLAGTDDDVERQVHALEFWDQVVDAADSMVFRLMFNSLRAAYEPALEALAPLMAEEVGQVDAYRVLTAALGAGDPETARAAADRVLRPATESLLAALAALAAVRRGAPMTKPTPEIEALAAQRLAADEDRITGQAKRRQSLSLRAAGAEFWKHPSPWLIATFLVGAIAARVAVGGGSWWELVIPAALIALFPVIEWCIHVAILHWKPRTLGPVTIDSLLARDHRAHHADPRDLPLVFIPWKALVWLLPAYVAIAWLAMPTTASAFSLLVSVYGSHVRLRVDPLPGAQRPPAEVALVPLGVAQPPAAPLQERALLVHRDQRRYGGPAVRHLPGRPVRGADVTDRQGAARPRGDPLVAQHATLSARVGLAGVSRPLGSTVRRRRLVAGLPTSARPP